MTDSTALACHEARQLIQAELDRPLLTYEALSLRGHLTHCDQCRAYRADLCRVQALLSNTGHDLVHASHGAPDLTTRVSRQVQRQQPRRRLFSLVQVAAQVGGLAIVVMFALRLERMGPTSVLATKAQEPVVEVRPPSVWLPASARTQIPAWEFAGDQEPAVKQPTVVGWPARTLPGMLIPD